VVALKW